MKSCIVSVILALSASGLAEVAEKPQSKMAAAFEKLKALVGTWEATDEEGKTVRVTYEVVSDGSVLMERLAPAPHGDMVTMYHLDGDELMLTHYCSAGNQPRMRAAPAAGDVKALSFNFLDATNLASPGDGHMHNLVVTLPDGDRFRQEWTWQREGERGQKVFNFTRKKS